MISNYQDDFDPEELIKSMKRFTIFLYLFTAMTIIVLVGLFYLKASSIGS